MAGKSEFDGGFCALVGFLYQFVGSFRYSIQIRKAVAKQGEDQEIEFLLEAHDQDAAVIRTQKGRSHRCLIQFKYSVAKRVMPPSELQEICKKLKKAKDEANQMRAIDTDFLLVTNRSFSPEAQKIWDDAHASPLLLKAL